MMRNVLLLLLPAFLLTACISGIKKQDTYTDRNGDTTVIQSDREMCTSSCNEDYSRCMETQPAQTNPEGMGSGIVGASADCRSDLKDCLPRCKGQ